MPSKEVLQYYGLDTPIGKVWYLTRKSIRFIVEKLAHVCPSKSLRSMMYRWCGLHIGKDVYIGDSVLFDRAFPQMITIKDHAAIGDRCIITGHAHIPTDTPLKKIYPRTIKPVVIEEGAWLMPNVTVICGVTIGKEAVVATGAVVTKDVPPHTLVAGVPAKVVKNLQPIFEEH